jgi:hypothetical protein
MSVCCASQFEAWPSLPWGVAACPGIVLGAVIVLYMMRHVKLVVQRPTDGRDVRCVDVALPLPRVVRF